MSVGTIILSTTIAGSTPPPPFSHDDWSAVVGEFVNERGMVDYDQLAKQHHALDRYLAAIEENSPATSPELFPSRDHALAYYINAYNAQVFAGVLARGPEKRSVWSGLISGYTFFVHMKIRIGGQTMNLKSLEDELIRADFADPRVHAALNCASLGCPRLPQHAFDPDTLDQQLTDAMTEFVSEARNVSIDASRRRVTISKIFDWFEGDFLDYERRQGLSAPRILDYINRFRAPNAKIPKGYSVRYARYDKSINAL